MRPNALVIISHNNNILLIEGKDEVKGITFYRLLGGGIEFGETSLVALRREIMEELGLTLTKEILLKVIENIFEFNGKTGHEITFLYKGEITEEKALDEEKLPILDKDSKYATWVSISDIKEGKIEVFPKEILDYI